MRGAIAAGHPLTAEAGAEILREGGNAVDAAVCAALTSFAVESPLTGLGAGGFLLVEGNGVSTLTDFFVAAPGHGDVVRGEELVPVQVPFTDSITQVFNVGAASCGVPGTAAGLDHVLALHGTMPMTELVGPGVRWAREGAPLNRQQAYVLRILESIYTASPGMRSVYAPDGRLLGEGDVLRIPDLADTLEAYAAGGAEPFYAGEYGRAIAEFVGGLGGTLSREDLCAYRPIDRQPVEATFRGARILTNAPPSSGGILIALCLELLERIGEAGVEQVLTAMRIANEARNEDFVASLSIDGGMQGFLDPARLDALGSTTHLVAIDAEGLCASITCSNGTGSGVMVPGTGIHLNNMLGEEDLNPLGFHQTPPGSRLPSMMSPTVVLRGGEVIAGLGSAGSNRIRSAILQVLLRLLADGRSPGEAISAARIHFESGVLQAEPQVDPAALARIEESGVPVVRWQEQNLFFGGVQAVTRDPETGVLDAAGDPRRGGASIVL